jgi:ATP-dependent Clp protease ATP-binding subunit ClpC
MSYAPRTKKVLEQSAKEARDLGQNYVGTEHLLLALLFEREGVAAQALIRLGMNLNEARDELLRACGGEKTEEAVAETAAVGVAVQTMTVERREMASENTVSGRINAEDEAVIMIGVAAKCTKTNVKAGDEVKKGDILCTLDLASTLSQYSAAQISYA